MDKSVSDGGNAAGPMVTNRPLMLSLRSEGSEPGSSESSSPRTLAQRHPARAPSAKDSSAQRLPHQSGHVQAGGQVGIMPRTRG